MSPSSLPLKPNPNNPFSLLPPMDKLKAAPCFSCCFGGRTDADDSAHVPSTASLARTSTDWVRSRALGDLPDRCRGFVARIGRNHRRREFGYDPLSYSLNFDDGPDFDDNPTDPCSLEELRLRVFSSRLPASPPEPPPRGV